MIPKNRLSELRARSRLTQEEVAILMNINDITIISKHENSKRPLTNEVITKYAKLYKVQTHEIFFDLEPKGDVASNG